MSELEPTKQQALDMMAANGLEVLDWPARLDITNHPHSQANVTNWSMRIGDVKTNTDLSVDSANDEHALWREAIEEIKRYLRQRKA